MAEKLLRSKLSVQAYESELKLLAQPEADKVFEAVRAKIMGGDVFDTMPPGVDGLVVLVKAQPGLQGKLLDFLEALPTSRCGPWVVGGWQGVIKDAESVGRLERLLDGWSKVTNNTALKAAADAVNKTRRGGR